jgi:hypothetical protein
MHDYNKTFFKVLAGMQVASRLSSVCMACFNLFRSGIYMVGPVAELTDAASTSNGLNTLTYSSDISHPSSLSSDLN